MTWQMRPIQKKAILNMNSSLYKEMTFMRKTACLCFLLGCIKFGFAQMAPCQSAYDNMFNNSYAGTSYIPGPMPVPLNTDIRGVIDARTDVDYYKFYITTGGTIRLRLFNLPTNYHLRLVNSIGNTILTSANSGTNNEVINYTATSNTEYFALVYPANNRSFNASACYTVRIETITATRLTDSPSEVRMQVFPNPVNDKLTVRLFDEPAAVRVAIINVQGMVVAEKAAAEEVVFDLSDIPAGFYLVDVYNAQGLVSREKVVKQ
jgi:hypothetical protein